MSKLSIEVIQLWTKTHWSQLDPYSDIDEDTKPDKSEKTTDPPTENPALISVKCQFSKDSTLLGGHALRHWKRHYTMDRPQRESAHTFYRNMCLDHNLDYLPSKPKTDKGLKTPSCDRIHA